MGRSRRDQTNDTDDLRRTVEQRREALRTVNELRSPLWDAITAELDRGKSKGSFSRRATTESESACRKDLTISTPER